MTGLRVSCTHAHLCEPFDCEKTLTNRDSALLISSPRSAVPPKDPANLDKMYDSCSKAAKSGGGHGGHHEGESGGVLNKVKNIIKK